MTDKQLFAVLFIDNLKLAGCSGEADAAGSVVSGSLGLAMFDGPDFAAEDMTQRADTDMCKRKTASSKPVVEA